MKKNKNDGIKDPVCGMSVDEQAVYSLEQDGKKYYFCGEGCRMRFLAQSKSAAAGGK